VNEQIVRFLSEDYPHGIPAREVRVRPDNNIELAAKSAGTSTGFSSVSSVIFSGPSAARLSIVFFVDSSMTEANNPLRDLVVKAVTSGLQRLISEVLLVQVGAEHFSPDALLSELQPSDGRISLADCSSKVVLLAGAQANVISDAPDAKIIVTDSISAVLQDKDAKKRFWLALRSAWEESQK